MGKQSYIRNPWGQLCFGFPIFSVIRNSNFVAAKRMNTLTTGDKKTRIIITVYS